MRNYLLLFCGVVIIAMASCRSQKGCPSSGKNVGAERLLSGDKKTEKAVRRAGKFRS